MTSKSAELIITPNDNCVITLDEQRKVIGNLEIKIRIEKGELNRLKREKLRLEINEIGFRSLLEISINKIALNSLSREKSKVNKINSDIIANRELISQTGHSIKNKMLLIEKLEKELVALDKIYRDAAHIAEIERCELFSRVVFITKSELPKFERTPNPKLHAIDYFVIHSSMLWQYSGDSYHLERDTFAVAPEGYYWKYDEGRCSYFIDEAKWELEPLSNLN